MDEELNFARLRTKLTEMIAVFVEIDPSLIKDDKSFEELGLDSLMRLEMIAYVEQEIGREIPEDDLHRLSSIAKVENYVSSNQ